MNQSGEMQDIGDDVDIDPSSSSTKNATSGREKNNNIDSNEMAKQSNGEPSRYLVHAALCTVQVIFGISAVVGSIGLPSFHPLTFALYRESSAACLLLTAAHIYSLRKGREDGIFSGSFEDIPLLFFSGLGIFTSQAFYLVGIKLSSAVAASVWQPSQPILTAGICMILGLEPYNPIRVLGIIIAFFGCAIMVVGGEGGGGGEAIGGGGGIENASEAAAAFANFVGQICFFIGCIGSSGYVLVSKKVLNTGRYESVAVTAWSYTVAALLMLISATSFSMSPTMTKFLCMDCEEGKIWHVPPSAIPAMIWFVVMTSSSAYGLMTWANKHATGTLVIGYSVLQPIASAILIQVLVSTGLYESCATTSSIYYSADNDEVACLEEPDVYTAIGAIGVFLGLFFVIKTEPAKVENAIGDDELTLEEEAESLLELTERKAPIDKEDDEEDTEISHAFNYQKDDGDMS